MAHENLRFNVMLRSGSDPLANSQATLNPIYSDQAYGTQYGVFAHFKPKDLDKKYSKSFHVGKLHLKLQNYSGAVTIGIAKIWKIVIDELDEKSSMNEFKIDGFSKRHIKLYLILQPLNNTFEENVTFDDDNQLTLLHGDLLEVITFYLPADTKYSCIEEEDKEKAFFVDSKYQIRDGETIENLKDMADLREIITTAAGASGTSVIPKSEDKNFPTGEKGDPRCKMKSSDIYIV